MAMPYSQPLRRPVATVNPLLEYLPDFLAAMIIVFMSMRLFGVGPLTALIWLSCSALLIAYRFVPFGRTLLLWWPLLLTPILLFLSFTWSDAPDISARYGFQTFLTCLMGVFIAQVLTPKRFAMAMFFGMLAFCLASIASGRQGAAEEGMVLIGLTGSKNAMGFAANMLFSASVAVIFLPNVPSWMRALGVFGAIVGAYVVANAASATAVVLTVAVGILFLVMCAMQKFSPAARAITILAGLAILAPLAFATDEITAIVHQFMRDVLHKDPTSLTGRTYLWERADELIARRPLLGYGYQTLWLSESSDTLGLLRWAGKTDGRSFNFHHTYRQIAVDIGLVGAGVLALTLIVTLFAGIKQFIFTPTIATSFTFSFLLITLIKSFTELVVGAFMTQTLLMFACCAYCFWRPPVMRQAPPRPG